MSKLLLLYLTLVTGLLFLVLPEDYTLHDLFLFSDMKLSRNTYIYFIGEKVSLIALAYIIYNESTIYREAIKVFFWLVVVDLLDFLLCYGAVYFYMGSFPVSYNTIKCFLFGVTILTVWIKSIRN